MGVKGKRKEEAKRARPPGRFIDPKTKWDSTPCWTGASPEVADAELAYHRLICPRCGHRMQVGHGAPSTGATPHGRVVAQERFNTRKYRNGPEMSIWYVRCWECGLEFGRGQSHDSNEVIVVRLS